MVPVQMVPPMPSVPPPPTSRCSLSQLVSPEDFLPPFDLEAPSSSTLTPTAACQSIQSGRLAPPSCRGLRVD
ncbi:hypothetical protein CHARACLAT_028992 [Characodon lateralis]|uniref:Uncharacterized protein n=1 Tax=Characodon lateralis TaxID=208331 RepID=A0ABU7DV34_9TELE|nr:hypothetical protein [Characodon lateralis]